MTPTRPLFECSVRLTLPGAGRDCTSACFDRGSHALNFASHPPVRTVPVAPLYSTHRTAFSCDPSTVTAPVSRSTLARRNIQRRPKKTKIKTRSFSRWVFALSWGHLFGQTPGNTGRQKLPMTEWRNECRNEPIDKINQSINQEMKEARKEMNQELNE